MELSKKFKENLGAIIAICTILGVGIGILNFFILTSIAPIEKRVEALENMDKEFMPLDLSTEKWKNNDKEHIEIMKKLDTMDVKLDIIVKEIN